MANKYNHFKLWLYQKLGVGWSAHWSIHGDLLAVYYLPTRVIYEGGAPNKRLHWTLRLLAWLKNLFGLGSRQ
jgi:hypothetical protein